MQLSYNKNTNNNNVNMNQPCGFDLSFILYKKAQLTNDNLLNS